MIKLSIVIPTFNRRDRLRTSLLNYTQEKQEHIEYLVVDNCSEDDTEGLVRSMMQDDDRIKYFKNPSNLGYNRNLFRGYLESNSDWICIMPDDDSVEFGFFSELIELIEQNNDCSLILCAQKINANNFQKLISKTRKFEKGTKAFEIAFKGSGTVLGFTFNKKKIDQRDWLLDNSIYPQIRLATQLSIEQNIIYFVPENFPVIGAYDSIDVIVNDAMGRPIDFGVLERLNILIEISKKLSKIERKYIIYNLSSGLLIWSISISKMMYAKNNTHATKFLESLFFNRFIKSSWTFLGFVIFKFVFGKKIIFSDRIKVFSYVFKSIFMSLFNANFYISFFFSLKNLNKLNKYE